MISMVLEGAASPDQLPIRPSDFYQGLNITPMIGKWVREIDVEGRQVRTENGKSVPYDRLLIAAGADPRPVKTPGANLANISFMRTEAHVRNMVAALPGAKKALVLGGGLVGFKAAYGLMHRGLDVTMLIRSDYPLAMQVDAEAGAMVLRKLIDKGLKVHVGAEVEAFEGNGKVRRARLTNGAEMDCDLVVIGKGVRPAASFLPKDRIKVDLGILVDDHMETSVPGVYAAGDVAEHFDIARKSRWVNAIWPVAVEQGRIAAMNMAGRKVAYKGSLSRNVIRIFDMDVLTGGIVNPPQGGEYEVLHRYDPRRNAYRKLVFREDKLVGVVMVNGVEQGGLFLSLIQQELPLTLPKDRLLDPYFNFACLPPGRYWQKPSF
jgi:NAD(P)H-nitrite reductase large subunit